MIPKKFDRIEKVIYIYNHKKHLLEAADKMHHKSQPKTSTLEIQITYMRLIDMRYNTASHNINSKYEK